MSSKRGRDAEDAKRRKLARQRLRGIIRSVIFNRIWLNDIGDQKLSLNVKKNIAMLVRTQRKIGMLTLAEKTLLRTHVFYRSIEDRRKLTSFFASLTCFSRFPPKVRARLAPVVKFLYVNSGRIVMREGDLPMTLYFILTGEIEISSRVFDPMKKVYVEKPELISGPGDCLGEVEMIENIRRKNTYTVTSDVELLVVFADDFDRILRPVMAKQWFEKKTAINTLDYFSFFTNDQIITACKLGILRQFEPLETICYEDKGQASYVYFVLSGECMILQCLKIKEAEKWGNKTFELVDISTEETSTMFQELTNAEFMQKLKEENSMIYKDTFDISQEILSVDSVQNEDQKKKALQKMDIKGIEISCGFRKPSQTSLVAVPSTSKIAEKEENVKFMSKTNKKKEENIEDENESVIRIEEEQLKRTSENTEEAINNANPVRSTSIPSIVPLGTSGSKISSDPVVADMKKQSITNADVDRSKLSLKAESVGSLPRLNKNEEAVGSKQSITSQQNIELRKRGSKLENTEAETEAIDVNIPIEENEEGTELEELEEEEEEEEYEENSTETDLPLAETEEASKPMHKQSDIKIENHFIDVGSVTFSGIFGLGEKLEHRVIMARTTVQCLMLPRFWLFERDQNPGNVWQRRRFYLDCTIPSRQKLFKDFLSTRKWQKFKKNLIESNLNLNATNNPTKVQDIPIICRIVEAHD